jgi:hypothetical protein
MITPNMVKLPTMKYLGFDTDTHAHKAKALRENSRGPFPEQKSGEADEDGSPVSFNLMFDFTAYST